MGYAIDGEVIVDSDSLLTLQRIPASMIVVGGGVIGCEYACIFAALGVARHACINARGRLLAHLDPEVSDALRQPMTARLGVTVVRQRRDPERRGENGRAPRSRCVTARCIAADLRARRAPAASATRHRSASRRSA